MGIPLLQDAHLDQRPDEIIWGFWKEVPGVDWEDATCLPVEHLEVIE